MPDIKIKRYADKENLKKLMKYSKDTFANKSEINEKFYTKEQIDTMLESDSGGGTGGDYYTKSEIDTKLNSKANKTTTLSGYGITDAYTKTQVDKKVSDLVNSAPETLDTLNELATALGNDPNFATTIATQIGNKANSSDVYNKSETDDLLLNKANASDLATKANDSDVAHKSGNETIAGTKTFSSNIVGNVTGNASTATTAKACTGNAATATKLATARSLWGNNFDGSAAITGIITGMPAIEFMPAATANMGGYLDFHYNHSTENYTSRIIESDSGTLSINKVTITMGRVVTAATFNGALTGNVTGNCSGSSGSCTGNALTATKLQTACTIALSGAATGTATDFDGSGNITIPVTALSPSAIRAQWYAAYPDGAEAHNAMWGGRDITSAFDDGTVSEHIADGTFRDIFPGDYITKQIIVPRVLADDGTTELFAGGTYTVNWVVADCDYWINKGDTAPTAHHVAIVPQSCIGVDSVMNETNTTEGGYKGSAMYKNIIPACATGIVNAFGSSHILTFRDAITNSVDTSHVSSGIPQYMGTPGWWGEWASVQCNLMSEKMVYGAPICSGGAADNVTATRQMSAFRLSGKLINYNRNWWWLRDVVSSANFAAVDGYGLANTRQASYVRGVRPFALLK